MSSEKTSLCKYVGLKSCADNKCLCVYTESVYFHYTSAVCSRSDFITTQQIGECFLSVLKEKTHLIFWYWLEMTIQPTTSRSLAETLVCSFGSLIEAYVYGSVGNKLSCPTVAAGFKICLSYAVPMCYFQPSVFEYFCILGSINCLWIMTQIWL